MYWRFLLLIVPILFGSFAVALAPGFSREIQLRHSDGTPVKGGVVRWVDDRERLGEAESLGSGTWSVPGRAVALEVQGAAVADALVRLDPGAEVIVVPRSVTLEVQVHHVAGGAPPLDGLRLLGDAHSLGLDPQCHVEDLMLLSTSILNGGVQVLAHDLQRRFGTESGTPSDVCALHWKVGTDSRYWIPKSPEQLRGVPMPDGTVRFTNVPQGAVVTAIADPRAGWIVTDDPGARNEGRKFGLSEAWSLSQAELTEELRLIPGATLEVEPPAGSDPRDKLLLHWRKPTPDLTGRRWTELDKLIARYDTNSAGRLGFARLEAGTYALQATRSRPGKDDAWMLPEEIHLGAGDRRTLGPAAFDPPADHVPLELHVLDTAGVDVLRAKSATAPRSATGMLRGPLVIEIDRVAPNGIWEYWTSFDTKVAPKGGLIPVPLLPPGESLRVRFSKKALDRMNHYGDATGSRLESADLEQVLYTTPGAPIAWPLRVAVKPSTP
jgi:hypothetical protein